MSEEKACCVANTNCKAPANCPTTSRMSVCFACGDFVCMNCSRRIRWFHYGRRRICDNCREMRDRP